MTNRTPVPAAPLTDDGRHDQGSPPPQRSGWRSISWGWWAAVALLVIVVILGALFLLGGDGDDAGLAQTASLAEVVEDRDQWLDERVVVSGRVNELLTTRALAIGSDLAEEDLLVLIDPTGVIRGYGLATGAVPYPVGDIYEVGDVVQVTGVVREFDRDALAEELGLVLNDELFDPYEGQMALVIDRLDVATVGTAPIVVTDPAETPAADEEASAADEESPAAEATSVATPVAEG